MRKYLFLLIYVCPALFAKLPHLTHRQVREHMHQILQMHVCENKIDARLAQRIVRVFLETIDPKRIYFTKEDLHPFLELTPEQIEELTRNFRYGKYPLFYSIREAFAKAILQNRQLVAKIETDRLLEDPPRIDEKGLEWPNSEKEKQEHLLLIQSWQAKIGKALYKDGSTLYQELLQKQATIRENRALSTEKQVQQDWVLTHLLKAFCCSLDTNTSYFTPREALQFMALFQQRFFGIGAHLKDTLEGFAIVRLLEGGPAHLSGKINNEDRIVAVDGEPVVGCSLFDVVEKIQGENGTSVHLTLLRDAIENNSKEPPQKIEIELIRGEVLLEEKKTQMHLEPFSDGHIACIDLASFYEEGEHSSERDVRQALELAKSAGEVKGVILDLRNNAGGLLQQAVKVTGLFMGNGIVVSMKDNQGRLHHSRSTTGKAFWEGPLIVLTNRASASGAEIVAGALQDYGIALLVGDATTYGKGTVQTVTLDAKAQGKVREKGEFRVTRGVYYTVSGKSPQLNGVEPDIFMPGPLNNLDVGERFSRFPIENDAIAPHFTDDLGDFPFWEKKQLLPEYRKHQQNISSIYVPYKAILQENVDKRRKKRAEQREEAEKSREELYGEKSLGLFFDLDVQRDECFTIMKDLLFLLLENHFEKEGAPS
ncbi:MAG: S41 family peptidase [Chlamydiota bacterium]